VVPRLHHVALDEPQAGLLLGVQRRDVVVAPPLQRLGVEVDSPGVVERVVAHPLTRQVGGGAEVLAQGARMAAEALAEDLVDELDVGLGFLHGTLVQRVLVERHRRLVGLLLAVVLARLALLALASPFAASHQRYAPCCCR